MTVPLQIDLEFVGLSTVGDAERRYKVREARGLYSVVELQWSTLQRQLVALRHSPSADDKSAMGTLLRQVLLQGNWEQHEQAVLDAEEKGRAIRITLWSDAEELYDLPWELVSLGGGKRHLADVKDCLVRYCRPGAEPTPGLTRDARVLMAWSRARERVPNTAHAAAIRKAAGWWSFDDADVLPNFTLATLDAALRERPDVQVLHLLCHGRDGRLVVNTEFGEARELDPRELQATLGHYATQLRLVVLCACEGADDVSLADERTSPAHLLHQLGIGTVLAYRYAMSVPASCDMVEALYQVLAQGPEHLESAVLNAQRAMMLHTGGQAPLQVYAHPAPEESVVSPVVEDDAPGPMRYREAALTLPVPGTLSEALRLTEIEPASTQVMRNASGKTVSLKDARAIGVALWKGLEETGSRPLLEEISGLHAAQRGGVRVSIDIDANRDVASYPWELLRHPDQQEFVFTHVQSPLVRRPQRHGPVSALEVEPPLRVLIATASPQGLPTLADSSEIAALQTELAPLVSQRRLVLFTERNVTVAGLGDALAMHKPHVLHVICHGGVVDGEPVLRLMQEDGSASAVSAERVSSLLQPYGQHLRLVFLNSCETARSLRDDASHGMAQRLVRRVVPAVVAMQFPIPDAAAVQIAIAFYRRLAEGDPIEACVSVVRSTLLARDDASWAAPALYLRSDDGVLFRGLEEAPLSHQPLPDRAPLAPGSPRRWTWLVAVMVLSLVLCGGVLSVDILLGDSIESPPFPPTATPKPTPTPTPTPIARSKPCGDGVCAEDEDHRTCPIDCQEPEPEYSASVDVGPLDPTDWRFPLASAQPVPRYVARHAAELTRRIQPASIRVEGHTDARGSRALNLALGARRAATVRDQLVTAGVSPSLIDTRTLGEAAPLDPAHPLAADNRRVEIRYLPEHPELYFATGSSTLSGVDLVHLMVTAASAREQGLAICVEGHADARGSRASNMELGRRRAEAAAEHLRNVLPPSQVRTVSYGEDRPAVPYPKNAAQLRRNRRVLLHLGVDPETVCSW